MTWPVGNVSVLEGNVMEDMASGRRQELTIGSGQESKDTKGIVSALRVFLVGCDERENLQ